VAIDSNIYLRSKVAHSWYGDEVRKHPDAISRDGLLSHTWCLGAGYNSACCEVPLAVVARAGVTTVFLDAWIVRRERIDTPPKRYWQWKMRMRPWDVFLAQVLQFQCQLADVLGRVRTPGDRAIDPCAPHYHALTDAIKFVDQVRSGLVTDRAAALNVAGADRPALLSLSLAKVSDLQERMRRLVAVGSAVPQPTDRILIRLGMIETPSFGYLPVLTGTGVSVNDQVRALLGEGLDLRFCITTADYIAHAGEEAQHMDRISLLQGLDDPSNKPKVDILVPDGKPSGLVAPKTGVFEASLGYSAQQTGGLAYSGAAREEALDSGGTALYGALAGVSQGAIGKFQNLAKSFVSSRGAAQPAAFTADLGTNPFVETARTAARTGTTIANTAFVAREFVARSAGTLAGSPALGELGAITTRNTADGLWLTSQTVREIRSLPLGGQTPVHFRAVFGSRPSSPLAFELMFHGTFTVSALSSAATVVITGTLNGTVSIGIYQESQQKTIEYLITERFNWPGTTFTYTGDDLNGSVALDVQTGSQPFGHVRLIRTTTNGDLHVQYRLAMVAPANEGGTAIDATVARLELSANAAVVDPANPRHVDAENALDIVQAALVVSEPGLKKAAEAELFPAVPAAERELRIDAVRDWVAFTRRRHKQCALDVAPAPPLPPRSYHVINVTLKADQDAAQVIAEFKGALSDPDPAKVAQTINLLLVVQQREKAVPLVVSYQGGSATALGDLTAADADWKTFHPGKTIKFVAIGAVGETDASLQHNRVSTFEGAITADSTEDQSTNFLAILPYPPAAVPPDADGVMIFITQTPVQVVVRKALLVYGNFDIENSSLTVNQPAGVTATLQFNDNVPQGDVLTKYIAALGGNRPVNTVMLSPTAAVDAGAPTRLAAVVAAVTKPPNFKQGVKALTQSWRDALKGAGFDPAGVDDVIFFSRQNMSVP